MVTFNWSSPVLVDKIWLNQIVFNAVFLRPSILCNLITQRTCMKCIRVCAYFDPVTIVHALVQSYFPWTAQCYYNQVLAFTEQLRLCLAHMYAKPSTSFHKK